MTNSSSSSKPLINDVNWYAIASKIRNQNEKLKAKISDLENLIEEQKQQIKIQVIKNQDYSNLEENQQKEVENLKKEIVNKNQQIEKQKETIETLTEQLEKIQQQTARLERECSLLQDNYNDQQHQLKQVEKENKELKIRLQRQQRYNIQYKTALDQVIGASSADNNSLNINPLSNNNLSPLTNHVSSNQSDNKGENKNSTPSTIDEKNHPIENILNTPSFSEDNTEVKQNASLNLPLKNQDSNNNREKKEGNNGRNQEKKQKKRGFIQLPQFGKKNKD